MHIAYPGAPIGHGGDITASHLASRYPSRVMLRYGMIQ
jgi:hypothetical protein